MQGGRCPQMMPVHQKLGRQSCPFSLGHGCAFKSGGISLFGNHVYTEVMLFALPSMLHGTRSLGDLTLHITHLLLFYGVISKYKSEFFLKKRNLNKQHVRPAPTGTGHAIGWHGRVEDIKEPMHTNFGVPGLSSYPAIRYFVPALT